MSALPVALVTGAGSGIGRATSLALSRNGFRVILAGRTESTLAAVAVELQGPGKVAVLDVTVPGAPREVVDRIVADHGRLDLLINNAGTFGAIAPIQDVTDDGWSEVIDVNLTGAFRCAQAAFTAMLQQRPQGGRIINIGSISAHRPRPHAVAYTASKHAITGLTKALSLEGRAYSIACGQIDIGNAATAMTAGFGAGALQPDGSVLAEPTMDVEEVAAAIVVMAQLPLTTNVATMTIMATGMPYVGRG